MFGKVGRLQAVLAIAATLGIGGGAVDARQVVESRNEPAEITPVDENVRRIIARSREDQRKKRERRQARWNKSEAGRRRKR